MAPFSQLLPGVRCLRSSHVFPLHHPFSNRTSASNSPSPIPRTLLSELFYFSFGTPERVPLALARYHGEAIRLYGVLETVLERKEWLVGGKMTIADVAFTTYVVLLRTISSVLTLVI